MKKHYLYFIVFLLISTLWGQQLNAQGMNQFQIDLSLVNNGQMNQDQLLKFSIHSTFTVEKRVKVLGKVNFDMGKEFIHFEAIALIRPGINLNVPLNDLKFEYSSTSLKNLVTRYNAFPATSMQYCVQLKNVTIGGETENLINESECIYETLTDDFLIQLLDPEDGAYLYEFNPSLSWMVNSPLIGQLNYTLKLTELKKGQQKTAAIQRNRPLFKQSQLKQFSLLYPASARKLEVNQPYVWTVEAYFDDLFMGVATPFKFTIIEDTLAKTISQNPSYIDIEQEYGSYDLYAPGELKLKYDLRDLKVDSLELSLLNDKGNEQQLKHFKYLVADYGDNRFVVDFANNEPLRHRKKYTLIIRSQNNREFRVLFTYLNPDLIQ